MHYAACAALAVIVHLYVSGEMVSDIIQHHDVRDKKGNPILSAASQTVCVPAASRFASIIEKRVLSHGMTDSCFPNNTGDENQAPTRSSLQ